ncbi:MAG: iron response transcriptional regulator IrrA [Alphaproteobacteria bacterium]
MTLPLDQPSQDAVARLRAAGLRPTRQRVALARTLFAKGDRHVTAEQLHAEAQSLKVRVSLATVYNTLHQFTRAGLLRELAIATGRSYFDTNTDHHHHFFYEGSGQLVDVPGDMVHVAAVPTPPKGTQVAGVDVIIRITETPR